MGFSDFVAAIFSPPARSLFSGKSLGTAQQAREYFIVGQVLDSHGISECGPKQDGIAGGEMHHVTGEVAVKQSP